MKIKDLQSTIGNTPLVKITTDSNHGDIFVKLEGNNPGGSVKDRPALNMILEAELNGSVKPGDTLIEATSGNTGIALSMVAAIKGYNITIIMPETASIERIKTMEAYGAKVLLVSKEKDMEGARDLAKKLEGEGKGYVLDQFSNKANYMAHYKGTGPEIWDQTNGNITHFISAMGTTGTITGVSMFLKTKNPAIKIIGVQPEDGSKIPGIRRWSKEYVPEIRKNAIIDEIVDINQSDAEYTSNILATKYGLFSGLSAAANIHIAKAIAKDNTKAKIVTIMCDRGDRYISKL